MSVRVRIAPSPTGDPHVGTAYIALFNFAFARKHGGQFVLRVEDTDQERSSRSSEAAIFEALRWLGLQWDEGPDVGGPLGPYRQSERTAIYREHAEMLLGKGAAYRCFCTQERLEVMRKEQAARKQQGYDRLCRGIAPQEAKRRADAGEPYTLRLAVPLEGKTIVHDGLRGEVEFANETVDDQVLMKSDGFPTYHLANVVDDHLMRITHVIRGEDWLTSTPKHVLLYEAFGWEQPAFYHLALLRNPDGSKLSKRKNPVSINHYRDLGYMPETFLNFLGTLGFSMGEDRERFTLQEMIDGFEFSRVGKSGAIFDPRKLDAFSGDDIRALPIDALRQRLAEQCFSEARMQKLIELSRERIARLDDFIPYVSFFFGAEVDYETVLPALQIKKRTRQEVMAILGTYLDEIEKDKQARAFTIEAVEAFSRDFCTRHGWKPKDLFQLLRVATTGRTAAPPLFDTLVLLGKDRVRLRLRGAMQRLQRAPDW